MPPTVVGPVSTFWQNVGLKEAIKDAQEYAALIQRIQNQKISTTFTLPIPPPVAALRQQAERVRAALKQATVPVAMPDLTPRQPAAQRTSQRTRADPLAATLRQQAEAVAVIKTRMEQTEAMFARFTRLPSGITPNLAQPVAGAPSQPAKTPATPTSPLPDAQRTTTRPIVEPGHTITAPRPARPAAALSQPHPVAVVASLLPPQPPEPTPQPPIPSQPKPPRWTFTQPASFQSETPKENPPAPAERPDPLQDVQGRWETLHKAVTPPDVPVTLRPTIAPETPKFITDLLEGRDLARRIQLTLSAPPVKLPTNPKPVPALQSGGYAPLDNVYRLAENGREFVLSNSLTRVLEQRVGGMLTSRNVAHAVGGHTTTISIGQVNLPSVTNARQFVEELQQIMEPVMTKRVMRNIIQATT